MRTALSFLFLVAGLAMFVLGTRLNAASPSDVGAFLAQGLKNGSIWLCFGGGLIASLGAVSLSEPEDRRGVPRREDDAS